MDQRKLLTTIITEVLHHQDMSMQIALVTVRIPSCPTAVSMEEEEEQVELVDPGMVATTIIMTTISTVASCPQR